MPIQCPPCQWPAVLDERGPPEDPTILLMGMVQIGKAAIRLVAVRVDPASRATPDYVEEISVYQEGGLDAVLDAVLEEMDFVSTELSELLGEGDPSFVEFADRPYRIWLVSES
jgi:hypothetical protein